MSENVRRELEATLRAREELGPEHDDALVAGFVDRIGPEIDRRVDERVAKVARRRPRESSVTPGTLAVCIPIIAIAGGTAGAVGIAIVAAALVIVFAIAAYGSR